MFRLPPLPNSPALSVSYPLARPEMVEDIHRPRHLNHALPRFSLIYDIPRYPMNLSRRTTAHCLLSSNPIIPASSGLCQLPVELICQITAYLESSDFAGFRLSCS